MKKIKSNKTRSTYRAQTSAKFIAANFGKRIPIEEFRIISTKPC